MDQEPNQTFDKYKYTTLRFRINGRGGGGGQIKRGANQKIDKMGGEVINNVSKCLPKLRREKYKLR